VITPDDGLLTEASFGFVDDDRHHPVRRRFTLGPLEHLDGTAATVAFGHADAYFHWLFDVLPRLEILRLAGWDETRWDHLVVNAAGAAYERETLHRFGVPAERIRVVDDGTQLVADRLVVPSTVGVSGKVPVWASQLLRERLLPPTPTVGPPLRLYISRSDTEQRRLADEDSLLAMLEPLGITCITLTGRPLDEQIELFSRAEIVIGPHGGGLSNLVWCRPGTAVVELYADDYVNPVFWRLSGNLGLRHHHVIGRPATPGLPSSYGAMVVDQAAVARLTEHALDGLSPAE
jgi:capsular polysaccharide biosynthesis protein